MDQLKESSGADDSTILIVDNEQAKNVLLQSFLRSTGYSAMGVSTCAEAIASIESSEPDAVVLDVTMPDTNGWETFTKIRARSDVPVLFLSTVAAGEGTAQTSSLNDNCVLHQPFYPFDVLGRLGTLIRNRKLSDIELPLDNSSKAISSKQPTVSVVIPAYNEEAGLPMVLQSVCSTLDDTYEIIVVDDGSSDATAAVAKTFPCRLIQHPQNRGKGAALRTGLQQARGKQVIFIDADNTYPVDAIPTLSQLLCNHDLVRGVRSLDRKNIGILNRVGNMLFDAFVRLTNMVEGEDILSGLYGGQRDKLLALDLTSERFDIEAEISVKAKALGLKSATCPIRYAKRVGESKLNAFRDGFRILSRIMQLSLTYNTFWQKVKRFSLGFARSQQHYGWKNIPTSVQVSRNDD